MKLILLQIGLMVVVTGYLARWVIGQRRRGTQSWQSLIARLRLQDSAGAVGALSFEQDAAAPWRERLVAARSVWTMFANTGVLLEMADYAERPGESADSALIAGLRMDATLARLYALRTLAKLGSAVARDATVMNALRAQAAYAEMTLRMTEMLETDAGDTVPSFVAAV
jgi:hypothetical protein